MIKYSINKLLKCPNNESPSAFLCSLKITKDNDNKLKTLYALNTKEDFEKALANQASDVLLFGTKEEEVGMANMDRWLDYFEALEIL